MTSEFTPEQVAKRAQDAARRLMATPYKPRTKPRKTKAIQRPGGASKPGKRAPTGEAF
jgi:hypothetical protein